jgi:ACS family hexuronate transporter-like MFS transporter
MFVIIGATGFAWAWFWARLYGQKQSIRGYVTSNPPKPSTTLAYLRLRAVWGLMIGRCLADPVWWFYVFWLPEYLARSRGFAISRIGSTLWIPFVFAALGSGLGGYASGVLLPRFSSPVFARKLVIVPSAALMLLGIPAFFVRNSSLAVGLISVVLFGYSSWAANILSLTADLFPSTEVARVTGLVGTAGAIGGMLFTLATGWLVQNVSYGPVFALASLMILGAATAVVWLVRWEEATRLPATWWAE